MVYRINFNKQTKSKSKYNNKSKTYNGLTYDSIKEANYAEELDWLIKAGEIQSWTRQVKIDLKVNGKHICNYYCDFRVINKTGGIEYHEVKGLVLPIFQIKWSLLQAVKDEILEPGAELIIIK